MMIMMICNFSPTIDILLNHLLFDLILNYSFAANNKDCKHLYITDIIN